MTGGGYLKEVHGFHTIRAFPATADDVAYIYGNNDGPANLVNGSTSNDRDALPESQFLLLIAAQC